jgi:hypothetical protein
MKHPLRKTAAMIWAVAGLCLWNAAGAEAAAAVTRRAMRW